MFALPALLQLLGRILLAWCCLSPGAWASQAPVDVSTLFSEPLSLTASVGLLEDTQGNLTLADVQAQSFNYTRPPGNAIALGFTRSAFWFRLSLSNTSSAALERMLVIDNPRISHIHAFIADAQDRYQVIATGCDTPFATRAYANRKFVFPITLPAHSEQVIYLRIQSNVGLLVPLQLWSPSAFTRHERDDYRVQAWYFGIASAMILFNLMLFIALREPIYLLYITFVSATASTLAIKNGMVPEWFWDGLQLQSNVAYYSAVSITVCTLLLFMRQMLNTAQLMPRVDRLLRGLSLFYLLTPLAFALALATVARTTTLIYLATVVVIVLVVLACAIKRQRSAYFFLGAFALLMLGGAMTTLRALGIVPTNTFTVDGMQLGSTLEMLLLAFALADRLNVMRREKAQVQTALLHTQQQLLETLKHSERELEKRVEQRTDELQMLNSELEALSLTDSLTGIANRRHFDNLLRQEWQRALRLGHPLALGILDVDYFKPYNDHYGHPAGDACLKQIARTLSDTACRASDLVARYGGEEFVFIATMSETDNACIIAQMLVDSIAALELPHRYSPLGIVTISIGVATTRPDAHNSPEILLQRADAALYQAKKQGRNRVYLAE